jgi:hypothetical protein
VLAAGRAAAERLGLRFEHHDTGLEPFTHSVAVALRPHPAEEAA